MKVRIRNIFKKITTDGVIKAVSTIALDLSACFHNSGRFTNGDPHAFSQVNLKIASIFSMANLQSPSIFSRVNLVQIPYTTGGIFPSKRNYFLTKCHRKKDNDKSVKYRGLSYFARSSLKTRHKPVSKHILCFSQNLIDNALTLEVSFSSIGCQPNISERSLKFKTSKV